jgi:hypothetical protein
MLLEGKAAIWLDSNPRVRALVGLGTDATADTIRELNDALKEEYPAAIMDTAEISAQMQMDTLTKSGRGPCGVLSSYHEHLMTHTREGPSSYCRLRNGLLHTVRFRGSHLESPKPITSFGSTKSRTEKSFLEHEARIILIFRRQSELIKCDS